MHPMFHRHMLEAQALAGKVQTCVRRERREGSGSRREARGERLEASHAREEARGERREGSGSRPVMPRFERGERLEASHEREEARGERREGRGESWPASPAYIHRNEDR